jgi:hypothetical protein
MAEVPHPFRTYRALYDNPANSQFVMDDETQERCYSAIFETFRVTRVTRVPLSIDQLTRDILADFSRSVRAVGVFVRDGSSRWGRLELLHGFHSYPGEPGRSRDRLVTFANVGDAVGTDIATVAIDKDQLAITADIVVSGSIARVQQLLREAHQATTIGYFTAEEANTRTTKARGMCYFPFELVEPLLGADLNAR